ncbi:MAG: type IV pilus assembly protein PilV [Motiliproteus sp.]
MLKSDLLNQPTHPEPPSSLTALGFTLIEILVAVLILAIGVLGLIGMESLALNNNLGAYQRSQASILAYDLADRMRANRAGVAVSAYLAAFPTGASHACVSYSGAASACSPLEIAENDIYRWTLTIADLLPGGVGSLDLASGIQTVTVSWDDNRDGALDVSEDSAESLTLSFGL